MPPPTLEPSVLRTGLESTCWTRGLEASPQDEITVSTAPREGTAPRGPPGRRGSDTSSIGDQTAHLSPSWEAPDSPRRVQLLCRPRSSPAAPLPSPPRSLPRRTPPSLLHLLQGSSLPLFPPPLLGHNGSTIFFFSYEVGQLNTIFGFFEPPFTFSLGKTFKVSLLFLKTCCQIFLYSHGNYFFKEMGIALVQLPLLPGIQLEHASLVNDVILLVATTGHIV